VSNNPMKLSQACTSSGERESTRTIRQTRWWTSLRGSWRSFRHGRECTVSNGESRPDLAESSDIPMPLVSSGVENGNLRELALARMKDFGAECRDVRYREVGVSAPISSLSLASRDSQSNPSRRSRAAASRLRRQWRLGNILVVRGPREGHSYRPSAITEMFGGRDVPQRAGRHAWWM